MKRILGRTGGPLRRLASFLLLPLTTLPLFGAVPAVLSSHRSFLRYYQSPPLLAPRAVLSATERGGFTPLPAYTGAIPVLAYHGINAVDDGYSVSQRTFAAQLEMLKLAGFHTVSIAQYNAFQHGETAGLPARPILITFDDGRFDSYRGADRVLAQDGFRATIYVITGEVAKRNPFYLNWTELHRMQASGRWDIQPHAFQGHQQVVIDRRGDVRPFYAMRRWTRSSGEETYREFQRRIGEDLFALADQFHSQGVPVYSIAVPFGDYGQQDAGNDPRVPLFDLGIMRGQFGTVFVQDNANDPPYTTPTGAGPQKRWEAHSRSTAAQLYAWLRRHDPAEPGYHAAMPSAAATSTSNNTE